MQNQLRISVVDHDEVFLFLVKYILEDAGYVFSPVLSCGESPHDEIVSANPDIVMLDTWLETSGHGWVLLQALRLDERTKRLPILVASSDPDEVRRHGKKMRTMKDVVVIGKPFVPDALLSGLRRLTNPHWRWDARAQEDIDVLVGQETPTDSKSLVRGRARQARA